MRRLVLTLLLLAVPAPDAHATLTLTPPAFGDFAPVQIDAAGPVITTAPVSNWSVNATGQLLGWHVDLAATQFATTGGAVLPLNSMTYRGPRVTAGSGQLIGAFPSVLVDNLTTVTLDRSANGAQSVSIINAAPGLGQGIWNMAQGTTDLRLTVPPNVLAGSYTSTITVTLSPGSL